MNMGNPVGWPVLQHGQQSTGVALVTTELVAQPLDGRDSLVRVSGGCEADGKIQDRLGHESGHGGSADMFDGDGPFPERSTQLGRESLERCWPSGVAVDQADLPVGQPEHGVIEAVHATSVRGRYARGYQPGRQAGLERGTERPHEQMSRTPS